MKGLDIEPANIYRLVMRGRNCEQYVNRVMWRTGGLSHPTHLPFTGTKPNSWIGESNNPSHSDTRDDHSAQHAKIDDLSVVVWQAHIQIHGPHLSICGGDMHMQYSTRAINHDWRPNCKQMLDCEAMHLCDEAGYARKLPAPLTPLSINQQLPLTISRL
jgi:hypothetical protein